MEKLRAAVIGVGYLGNFHAQKYAQHAAVDLHVVVDSDAARAAEIAARYNTRASSDYRSALDGVDLVSIVVPPACHYAIARDCLLAGIHTLVEKPVTERVEQAQDLIEIARTEQRVLQVGHLERFNPVLQALRKHIRRPHLIEAQRFASYKSRGTDVDVVLDLMIHDIDIVLSLIDSPVETIHATGTAVATRDIDIANARIEFRDGQVAELAASRVSNEPARLMKAIESDRYVELDYVNHELRHGRMSDGREQPAARELTLETVAAGGRDVLMTEISSFVSAVSDGRAPEVTGEDGKRALELAIEISRRINRHRATQASVPGET